MQLCPALCLLDLCWSNFGREKKTMFTVTFLGCALPQFLFKLRSCQLIPGCYVGDGWFTEKHPFQKVSSKCHYPDKEI